MYLRPAHRLLVKDASSLLEFCPQLQAGDFDFNVRRPLLGQLEVSGHEPRPRSSGECADCFGLLQVWRLGGRLAWLPPDADSHTRRGVLDSWCLHLVSRHNAGRVRARATADAAAAHRLPRDALYGHWQAQNPLARPRQGLVEALVMQPQTPLVGHSRSSFLLEKTGRISVDLRQDRRRDAMDSVAIFCSTG